jgi:hypothetical protein
MEQPVDEARVSGAFSNSNRSRDLSSNKSFRLATFGCFHHGDTAKKAEPDSHSEEFVACSRTASALALAGCVSQQETHGSRARSEGAFPADWTGRWTGALATLGDSKLAPVTMTLEIEPIADGRWSWTIIYEGEFGRQVRPYELVAVDAAAGQFVIDEEIIAVGGQEVARAVVVYQVEGCVIGRSWIMSPPGEGAQ